MGPDLSRWLSLFRKTKPVSGLTIMLLQRRIERYSDERLNLAMQRAWQRSYNEKSFFAISMFDGDGAVIRAGRVFMMMQHHQRRIGDTELGEQELPDWAEHSAHSVLSCKCPGGFPERQQREFVYGVLGRLCAELMDANISGLLFLDEGVLVPNTALVLQRLRLTKDIDPVALAARLAV
jgi:hypothetical protein